MASNFSIISDQEPKPNDVKCLWYQEQKRLGKFYLSKVKSIIKTH